MFWKVLVESANLLRSQTDSQLKITVINIYIIYSRWGTMDSSENNKDISQQRLESAASLKAFMLKSNRKSNLNL